jgi:hypothetical protein
VAGLVRILAEVLMKQGKSGLLKRMKQKKTGKSKRLAKVKEASGFT